LAGFTAHATLVHGGLRPEDVAVFDASGPDPAGVWRRRAGAIRQRWMRSESDGHCLPTSFPGLAVRDARRRRSVVPLALSAVDRYRPSVDTFLAHVEELRARSGWDESVRVARVDRIRAVDGGFALEWTCPGLRDGGTAAADTSASLRRGHVTFSDVLVCTGHPGLNLPDELAGDPRVVHAYEPHEYADEVAVVGAGMAAATEWLNALAAGARVVSVRRREPVRRPLNVPRPLFSRRGLAGFQALSPGARVDLLRDLATPSYPPGRAWDEPLRSGRFSVAAAANGAAQIVCATGFKRGFAHDPLLARLVADHGLETHGRWIALAPDCSVPALTDGDRTLALAGVAAQWAYPAADTIVGAKYAARGLLRRVERCRTR
jgi:cation diffusion facilitator CzcD-associated flavoprotein CzcO